MAIVTGLFLAGLLAACNDIDPEPHIAQLKSVQPDVREKAAGKLVIYGEQIVPRLIEETSSDYTRVRFEVARILGRIRDPRAAPAMIRMLDDSSFNVAAYAAWGLGELRAPSSVPTLLRFPDSPAHVFRQQVVWALGRCYDDSAHAALHDSVAHVVERALHDPKADVRIAALQSARELGYPGMVRQLIRMVRDPSAEVRHVAVQALGQFAIGDAPRPVEPVTRDMRADIVEALLPALDEPTQSIRTKAVRAFERMGPPPQVMTRLQRLLITGTEEDRREARRVLEGGIVEAMGSSARTG
ncbi:MAG: HEAT repeat domain-containing protein [bacterium]|nr:HEAT repeat domain-containing protein [bacterium]